MNNNKKIEEFVIELPDVHPSLNTWTRMHFHVRNDLKKQWMNDTYFSAKKAGLTKLDYPVEVFLQYFHPREAVDLDNYTPKFIMDGLKEFFVDDNIKCVKKLGWEFIKSKEKKTIIYIKKYEN